MDFENGKITTGYHCVFVPIIHFMACFVEQVDNFDIHI